MIENKPKKTNYKIVSLGHNCLPRTVLTRWGIKPDKLHGELTMPFDLATYETFEITNNIKDNFKDFFNNLQFKKTGLFFNTKQFWIKAPDLIEFVHEKNLGKNDKNKLVEIYKKRIENFKNQMEDPTPILFVQLLGDCQDINNLYEAISFLREDRPFKFVIIDPYDIVKINAPHFHILKLPYPNKKYQKNWWAKKYYKSKEGQLFEKTIVEFCTQQAKSFCKDS